jgi:hypothetical protein
MELLGSSPFLLVIKCAILCGRIWKMEDPKFMAISWEE